MADENHAVLMSALLQVIAKLSAQICPNQEESAMPTEKELKAKEQDAKFSNVGVEFHGNKIILPDGMDYETARRWLERRQNEENTDVAVMHEMNCYPLDGAVNFWAALKEKFGWVESVSTPGFFGDRPPLMISVPIGVNEFTQVPWGRLQMPAVDGYVSTGLSGNDRPKFVISGQVKKKALPLIREAIELAERRLKTHSIYKGKAVKVDFSWIRDGDGFDPTEHAPKFLDLNNISEEDLILNEDCTRALRLGLFGPLERSDVYRRNKMPLKRGVLLEGPYGTGKTLTALVTALKAVTHGWTFIYLSDVRDLDEAIHLGRQYQPVVIQAEDVDAVMNVDQGRSDEVNKLLNLIDGIDSKKDEMFLILTTNQANTIDPAMIRPGRIDVVARATLPDGKTASRLLARLGRNLLSPKVDVNKVGTLMTGMAQAIITEVVQRSKSAAIDRLLQAGHDLSSDHDLDGQIAEEDLIMTIDSMKIHMQLAEPRFEKRESVAEIFGKAFGESAMKYLYRFLDTAGLTEKGGFPMDVVVQEEQPAASGMTLPLRG